MLKWIQECERKTTNTESDGEDKYTLSFMPYDDILDVATINRDEEGDWVCTSETLNLDEDFILEGCEDADAAKEVVEDMLKEHYEDVVAYYQAILLTFSNGLQNIRKERSGGND